MCLHSIVLQLILVWAIGIAAAETLPDCARSCENINVSYPFGMSEGCYRGEEFRVRCNHTFEPHKLYLGTGTVEVTEIYLSGQLRILSEIARHCFDNKHFWESSNNNWNFSNKFPVSNTRNKFIAVGCDAYGMIQNDGARQNTTGCFSRCDHIGSAINGSCSGTGCCQADIPKGVRSFDISVTNFYNHSRVWEFNPCSYAFIVEEGNYSFSSTDLRDLQNRTKTPVILDWAIQDQTCDEARKNLSYACKADNSYCYDPFDDGPGYRCNCSAGYEGNPYVPNGCLDINECNTSSPCNMTCHNLPGTYNCSCPEGYEGDGRINGSGCSLIAVPYDRLPLIKIALGISIGISVLLLGGSWLYWGFRQRKIVQLREKFFQKNGGIMLQQQQLSMREGSVQSAKIFTAEELKKATNNYHESRVLGQGGQGTVYKGILPDNSVVAIKKSKRVDQSQIKQFINEVIVLSQVNHRNVVKLLGCCLETQVPLLVYEFVTNGTLYDHLHTAGYRASSITWENRLRIATETATALSYLHSATSTPIIHRDIKSTNILLDGNYTAKVSDFGVSRLVPIDQTQLTTLVQGTLGYLDPEYFYSSQLTGKSDVYSFGVVLVELLTGKKALSFDRPEEERNLALYFVSSMKEDRLFEIVDEQVMNEAKGEQIQEVAILAKSCLRVRGEERPSMKDVAMELEGLRMTEKHTWVNDSAYLEETDFLMGEFPDTFHSVASSSSVIADDSLRNQVISPFDQGGR